MKSAVPNSAPRQPPARSAAYRIPPVADSYSALFWMDYRDEHVPGKPFSPENARMYPYLAWAEAHFHRQPPPQPLETLETPLTWEAHASEAEYWRLEALERIGAIRASHMTGKVATPHTWHAAEMFLYLLADTLQRRGEKCTCSGGG